MRRNLSANPAPIPEVGFRNERSLSELEIIDLAELQKRAQTLDPPPDTPHRVLFNMLIFIESGKGAHLIDFEQIPIEQDSVLFLNKGQVQAFDFSTALEGQAILYTESFIEELKANMRIPFMLTAGMAGEYLPSLKLEGALKQSAGRLLDELRIETTRSDADASIAMSLFSALHLMLVRERDNPAGNLKRTDAQKYTSFLKLIEKHYHQNRDANFYSELLNTTYKTLNQLCKKATGKTAKYHIDQYVLLEAKRRLVIDQYDIATLANELGFDEPTNFTKFFKRHTGLTPKQFR